MTALIARLSTNVRFLPLAVAALASGACAAPAARTAARACPVASMLVCEQFGPERRCACERRADIGVLRDPSVGSAWLGTFGR